MIQCKGNVTDPILNSCLLPIAKLQIFTEAHRQVDKIKMIE